MAISNAEIMEAYRMENNIPEDKKLYTYGVWHKMGYQVKRGEASHYRVQMWKYTKGKPKAVTDPLEASQGKEKKNNGHCFMKTMNLFEESQVERIVK